MLYRILAALLGLIIFPLKALVYNLLLGIFYLFLAAALLILLPLFVGLYLYSEGVSILRSISFSIATVFLVLLTELILLPILAIHLLIFSAIDLIRTPVYALSFAMEDGFEGFLDGLFEMHAPFCSVGARWTKLFMPETYTGNIYDLKISSPKRTQKLSDTELDTLGKYLEDFPSDADVEALSIHTQLASLFKKYSGLKERLDDLDKAISEGISLENGDELMAMMNIEKPILVVKQYLKGETWQAIPNTTNLTDRVNFISWIKTMPTHSLTKEPIFNPPPYELRGEYYDTRYVWHKYEGHSQEIHELTLEMRQLMKVAGLSQTKRDRPDSSVPLLKREKTDSIKAGIGFTLMASAKVDTIGNDDELDFLEIHWPFKT